MKLLNALIALSFLLPAESVFSQVVFKCQDDSGTTVFSQSPCAADAEAVFVEDSSGGFLPPEHEKPTQTYRGNDGQFEHDSQSDGQNRSPKGKGWGLGDPSRTLNGQDRQQVNAARDRDREYDKAIRNVRGSGAHAERSRAELAISKAQGRSLNDPMRVRELDEALRKVRGTGVHSAQVRAKLEAAKFTDNLSGYTSLLDTQQSQNQQSQNQPTQIHAQPIPGTKGGFYNPTGPDGSQYIAPNGDICTRGGGVLHCNGVVKPVNGVVIEPDF